MKLFNYQFILLAIAYNTIRSVGAYRVVDVKNCPKIASHPPPMNVHDLRADDIKIIAAMGDSVTAGMVVKNIDTTYATREQFIEYRGHSWTMGGDPDVPSIANFIKHFSPDLYGQSKGQKPARLCEETFFCFDSHHDPEIDYLNAAQSGATSRELPEQVDYLVKYLGRGTPLADKWKLINVFIGFNDASVSCLPGRNVTDYKNNVKASLKKLIENIDFAFINLVGMMHYNDLVYLTDSAPGYKKKFEDGSLDLMNFECYCCRLPEGGTSFIGSRITQYNQALASVAEEVSGTLLMDILKPAISGIKNKDVAVVYQPMNVVIPSVPYNSLSNVDGYHPNTQGHSYLARQLWNQMFLSKYDKEQTVEFNADLPVYCPTAEDRLKTYKRML